MSPRYRGYISRVIAGTHTQVEVVFHAVTHDQDTGNSVDKGCMKISLVSIQDPNGRIRTKTGGVLSVEVAGLVATDEAGRLNISGGATGKASVEGHNTLHAGGILGGTDSLD